MRLTHNLNPARAVLLAAILAAAGVATLSLSRANESIDGPANSTATADVQALADEQIVVRYKAGADIAQLRGRFSQLGASEVGQLNNLRVKVLKVPKAARPFVIEQLKADPRVEFAEADAVATADVTRPNDPEYGSQWIWPVTLTDIMWDKSRGSNSMVIAVLDSGINFSHPEFNGKLVPGRDFVNNDTDPTDDYTHGTPVAGVIGAVSNNSAGIAAGCWECKIMPLKVIGADGKGSAALYAEAIEYAADNGAKVINLSSSGAGTNSVTEAAVNYALSKGAVFVSSAGNQASGETRWPANAANTIAVAATTPGDTLAAYSNFGTHIDIAAPGQVRSAQSSGQGYGTFTGTSFSTPAVAAILGVLRSAFPNATPAQLRNAILSTADPCCNGQISGGRINAIKAYNVLAGTQNADTAKPTVAFGSPSAGLSLSGAAVPVTLSASDNVAVAKVHLRIGDGNPGVTLTQPYNFTFNSTQFNDGTYLLSATAYDAAGNAATVTRSVVVNNANPADTVKPMVSITAPAEGATVSGNASPVNATVSDNVGIAKVELRQGSRLLAVDTTAPYAFTWNTTSLADGAHDITVRAVDSTGNIAEAGRTVTVRNTQAGPAGDLNSDGRVGITDLSMLLTAWGSTSGAADLNKSGRVDITDLSILLSNWSR